MTIPVYSEAIFIRHEGRFVKVRIADIAYLEARKNYCRVVTTTGSYLTLCTLKRMRELLPRDQFVQIHRGFIVAFSWIRSFDNSAVYGPDQMLPVGDSFRKVLPARVLVVSQPDHEPVPALN